MIRSMTAYARAFSEELCGLSFVCEVHSVNRKGFDLHLHLSKELLFLDLELRKVLREEIQRGQVTVRVYLRASGKGPASLPLLKKLKEDWLKLSLDLGYGKEEVDLLFLLEQAGQISFEDTFGAEIQLVVKSTLKKALHTFVEMKEAEGEALTKDIESRLRVLLQLTEKIESQALGEPESYRQRLLEKLRSILESIDEDERILREVALFAEKVDITEEIIRLRSHIQQAESLLRVKKKSVGRTFDFLTQEMLREINTIASKSQDLAITKMAIEGKTELEKIREQVQNIE